jgi:hypothetical protein
MAPSKSDIPVLAHFIEDALPREGVNTLVVEIDYNFQFQKHPEVAEPGALSKDDVAQIVQACKDAHVRLIPQINLLGHQSWAEHTGGLLRSHPEFDETRGKYPNNKGIYCRSYCPLNKGVHKVVFDLIDEVGDAFQSDAVHCGMDEVMILADPDCPRCHGKKTADLFAGEVKTLHDHLKSKGREMWMWGDRFIDGKSTGIGDWEASGNNTQDAIYQVPKDIVICDWHYDRADPTPAYFALSGFNVLACPWRSSSIGRAQVQFLNTVRKEAAPETAAKLQGVLETTWMGCSDFIHSYYHPGVSGKSDQVAQCFKDVMKAIREQP